jgi:hypothetical protein
MHNDCTQCMSTFKWPPSGTCIKTEPASGTEFALLAQRHAGISSHGEKIITALSLFLEIEP